MCKTYSFFWLNEVECKTYSRRKRKFFLLHTYQEKDLDLILGVYHKKKKKNLKTSYFRDLFNGVGTS